MKRRRVHAPSVGMCPIAAMVLTMAVGRAAAAPATAAAPADGFLSYAGIATLKQAPRFIYGEKHVLEYRAGKIAGRVVLYTCEDGTAFARKIVSYRDRTAPDFLLDDVSNGLREGVRSEAGARQVFFRQSLKDAERSAPLPATPGLVIDAGFDEFVRAHWGRLLSGEPLRFPFLVPSRLEVIAFQVQHLRSEPFDGAAAEVFRLKLSGLLGLIVPAIDVTYSAADHLLLRYEGLSDLRDAAGDNYPALIHFPADERVASSAEAMQAARAARLAPCR